MVLAAAAIVVGATTAISDIWLPPGGRLIAMSNGTLLPDWSIPVLLWLAAVIWALAITGILHVHWLPKTVLTLFAVMSLAMMGLSPYPVSLAVTLLALVALIVVIVVRSFFKQHWLEFPIVLMLVSAVVFGPDLVAPLRAGEELRLLGLSGMLSATQVLTVPILIGAGLAYAQISVTLVQAVVQRSYRISRRIPRPVVRPVRRPDRGDCRPEHRGGPGRLGCVAAEHICVVVGAGADRRHGLRPGLPAPPGAGCGVVECADRTDHRLDDGSDDRHRRGDPVLGRRAAVQRFRHPAIPRRGRGYSGQPGPAGRSRTARGGGAAGAVRPAQRRGEHNTTFVVLVAALFLVLGGAVPSLSGRRVSGGDSARRPSG